MTTKTHSLARRAQAFIALIAVLSISAPAFAERDAYMRIRASLQGDIRGGVTIKGRENTIAVSALAHEMTAPFDAATGQATGKRQHKPFVITKAFDRSSVPLRNAMTKNELLTEVTLQFYAPSATGVETLYMTVTLRNARITSMRQTMLNNTAAETAALPMYEEVSFVYQEITWTWANPGLIAKDTW
jgi:type VI secretion system secreted protein Hcp